MGSVAGEGRCKGEVENYNRESQEGSRSATLGDETSGGERQGYGFGRLIGRGSVCAMVGEIRRRM
jgi:hypothetical protein